VSDDSFEWDEDDEEPDDDDPFEQLGADVDGREGDPFDNLDQESTDSGEHEDPDTPTDDDTGIEFTEEDPNLGLPSSSGEDDASDSPGMEFATSDSDQSLSESDQFPEDARREGDPFDSAGNVFEEMDISQLDPDEVWEGLASAEARGSIADDKGRIYAEVSKHSYCEQCEHFSEPPDIECLYEGTEIVEFLDMDTVRLVDCPIVAERRELEQNE